MNSILPSDFASVHAGSATTSADANAGSPSLLAPPDPSGGLDASSLILWMQQMTMKMSDNNARAGGTRVTAHLTLEKAQIKKEQEAIKKAQEAGGGGFGSILGDVVKTVKDIARDNIDVIDAWNDFKNDTFENPRFWKDLEATGGEIAKWGAVAASIALAVGTAGTGAPFVLAVIGATLATAGAADSEFHVLEKLGVSAGAAQWADLGMSVGGAAASIGASFMAVSSASAASATASTSAANAGATTASTSAASAGVAAPSASAVKVGIVSARARAVGAIFGGTAAAGAVVAGAGKIGVSYFEAEAKDAEADFKAAEARQKRIDRLIQLVLDSMKDAYEASHKVLSDLQNAANTAENTNLLLLGRA